MAGRLLGPASFASFMAVWGLFFFLMAFLQGVQQEVVRVTTLAASSIDDTPRAPRRRSFSWRGLGLVVLGLLGAAAVLSVTVDVALPGAPTRSVALALTVALPLLVAHQVFNGALAGGSRWGYYATSLTLEALIRFVVVAAVILAGAGLDAQTWAMVAGTLGWTLLYAAAPVRGTLRLLHEVRVRDVVGNAGKSLLATAASALLINAFPVMIQVTSRSLDEDRAIGVAVAAVILTRAPLLMPLYAVQGWLIGTFARRRDRMGPTLARILAAVGVLTTLGAGAAALAGPTVVRLVFGEAFAASGLFLASLIVAAGLTACLTVASWAAMAAGHLRLYALAWVSTPVTATALLAMDASVQVRTATALLVAPLVGLTVLAVGHRWTSQRPDARSGLLPAQEPG